MIDLFAIPGAIDVRLGILRVDWDVVLRWMAEHIPAEARVPAWERVEIQWLLGMRETLDQDYVLEKSDHFRVLGGAGPRVNELALSWCEHYRREILRVLPGVARFDGPGRIAVLIFRNREAYLDYKMDSLPKEGEFGPSGGVFIQRGVPHFATWAYDASRLEPTIAHELVHASLAHLPLPLWLNEGVTQIVQDIVVDRRSFIITSEKAREHRAYWNSETIQAFWSGWSFHSPDDGKGLSYNLAEVLVRNLASDYPKKLADFVNSANREDAGNAALIEACGTSLSDRVAQFLGPGDWGPRGARNKGV